MINTFHTRTSISSCFQSARLRQRYAFLTLAAVVASLFIVTAPTPASADSLLSHPPIRIYRRRPVVVVHPSKTVVHRTEVVRTKRSTVTTTNEDAAAPTLGIGIRANGTSLSGEKLNLDSVENPVMGGIGVQFRSELDEHWGLELSVDYLQGTEASDSFTQRTVPVMLSALFNPFPNSRIRPYGLVGVGVHFTELSYLDGKFKQDLVEVAGQAGLGLEVQVTDKVSVHADLRFLTVYNSVDSQQRVSAQCMTSGAAASGLCSGIGDITPEDRFNLGAQFQAGATYYF